MTVEERLKRIEDGLPSFMFMDEEREDIRWLLSLVKAQREVCEAADDFLECARTWDGGWADILREKLKHLREVERDSSSYRVGGER